MGELIVSNPPFRSDLVTPDQLGSMLAGTPKPDLWFVDDLVQCAGKALARTANGDVVFVGRSLDSMFDLLKGAPAEVSTEIRLARLPFSFQRCPVEVRPWRWRTADLSTDQQTAARQVLTDLGLTPHALARRTRPVSFVDVVSHGSTFTELFDLLDDWIVETREPWNVISRKLRFIGVTIRRDTSPKTWRWQQHTAWTERLPAGAVVNVCLEYVVWSYFGDHQTKLTRSFRPAEWLAPAATPNRDDKARQALAEAVAVTAHGRSTAGRRALAHAIAGEPALTQPWLRSLVRQLNA
jgi:hypothetical protein